MLVCVHRMWKSWMPQVDAQLGQGSVGNMLKDVMVRECWEDAQEEEGF